MHRRVETDRALNLGNQIREDRPHRLENLPRVFARRRVALQILGLGEVQLERLHQRIGEIVSANGDRAQPDGFVIADDQVGVLGAKVNDHGCAIEPFVVVHGVVHGQRAHLHDLDIEVKVGEVLDVLVHQLFAHRKDSDLDIG